MYTEMNVYGINLGAAFIMSDSAIASQTKCITEWNAVLV